MKIVLPGGSGQVGTVLARSFQADGHEVVVLTRTPPAPRPWREVAWDAERLGPWQSELEKSRRVVPGRLLEQGFEFEFPQWAGAARDLCLKARSA